MQEMAISSDLVRSEKKINNPKCTKFAERPNTPQSLQVVPHANGPAANRLNLPPKAWIPASLDENFPENFPCISKVYRVSQLFISLFKAM